MSVDATLTTRGGTFVHANGIDIHYVEAGAGEPLLLLHGGMASTGPMWSGVPVAYVDHMASLAEHFHVIAPDTRGAGATSSSDATISYAVLAEDVLALIEALDLDRPMLCGFSDGGTTGTVVALQSPGAVRAVVNHAGYDLFNPEAATFAMGRQIFGGSPEATECDPDAAQRAISGIDGMREVFALMQADMADAQGPESWRRYLTQTFHRFTRSPGYTFDDLKSATVPTLVLVGDRDHFCSVEEGVVAYRALPEGELAVIPGDEHLITPAAIAATAGFLERHAGA